MPEIIEYILNFLLGEHISPNITKQIGYTSNPEEFKKYKLVIFPSHFFQEDIYKTDKSLPSLPLAIWEESPILFGEPKTEIIGDTKILYADLIASTFFLITRYEEIVRNNVRDVHGRFPGKESLPYKAGFIDRPLIEEYGKLLRAQLREVCCDITEPPVQIKKIYLTHDLDQIAHFRNIRGMLGGFLRGLKRRKEGQKVLNSFFKGLRFDPWYTFPFLFKLDNELTINFGKERSENVLFIRSGGGKRKEDKPYSNLLHPDYKNLIRYSKKKEITLGLHTSYLAGMKPHLISEEKKKLEHHTRVPIFYNRHHYLDCREPEHVRFLIEAGITDDFSMGYADMAGFRLGTCRPVKWIDIEKLEITNLTLHSLAIMDVTLSEKRYMFMNSFDAYQYCIRLIDCVEHYNGELILLWHNNSVEKTDKSYHRKLYRDIIKYLKAK